VPIIICCKIKQFNPIGVMDGLLERIEKAPPIERIGDVSASDGTPGTTIGPLVPTNTVASGLNYAVFNERSGKWSFSIATLGLVYGEA
jgi:hypothetical protein